MIIFAVLLSFPVSAMNVNTHEAKTGDIVTYDIHAIACPTKVQAVDISIFYDSTALEYVDGSLTTPEISGVVSNTDLPGEIRMNAVSLDGFAFKDDGILASVKFTVINDSVSDAALYYDVRNFIDEKKTELKDTYVYDITQVSSDAPSAPNAQSVSSAVSSAESSTETVSSDTSSVDTEENEVIIDLSSSSQAETVSRSVSSDDIPSDKAIRFDTLDTAKPDKTVSNRRFILLLLSGVGIVILIAVFFVILVKDRGGKGSHFSK